MTIATLVVEDDFRVARLHAEVRRRMMRHFGPPECPHMIAAMEPEIFSIFSGLLDNMRGHSELRSAHPADAGDPADDPACGTAGRHPS